MNINKIKSIVKSLLKEAIMASSYTHASKEYLLLSDDQLEDLSFSKESQEQGGRTFSWALEEQSKSHEAPLNLIAISSNSADDNAPITPQTPKAA